MIERERVRLKYLKRRAKGWAGNKTPSRANVSSERLELLRRRDREKHARRCEQNPATPHVKHPRKKRPMVKRAELDPEKLDRLRKKDSEYQKARRPVARGRQRELYATDEERRAKVKLKNHLARKKHWSKIKQRRKARLLELPIEVQHHTRLARNLRSRLRLALQAQRAKKNWNTLTLTGCSPQELVAHLESLFTDGMSWDNYGKWHVDHKEPCASFDLRLLNQQQRCFHYTNLQPLWEVDNLGKAGKRGDGTHAYIRKTLAVA